MAYNTPESVADYLSRFQMQVTERTKGTFSPMHVKYSLALKMGSSSFETTFQSNPNVHGEPTVTQVFGALASDTMLKNGNQFSLDGGIPAWTVEGDDLAKVNDFLKKSCMEFCGSLPGDEMGEDDYSLSGEARDAATSRNGLNENRKSVAEMIQECFDSIENNGDAI